MSSRGYAHLTYQDLENKTLEQLRLIALNLEVGITQASRLANHLAVDTRIKQPGLVKKLAEHLGLSCDVQAEKCDPNSPTHDYTDDYAVVSNERRSTTRNPLFEQETNRASPASPHIMHHSTSPICRSPLPEEVVGMENDFRFQFKLTQQKKEQVVAQHLQNVANRSAHMDYISSKAQSNIDDIREKLNELEDKRFYHPATQFHNLDEIYETLTDFTAQLFDEETTTSEQDAFISFLELVCVYQIEVLH